MRRELAAWAAFLVLVAALPLSGIGSDRYLMLLANVMLMFMALALSWDVVARTGQLSLAHGAFFGLGAYTVALGHKYAALHPLLGLPLAALAGALVALALGIVTLRLRGIYFAIATLAFAEVLRTVALQLPDLTGGPVGISMPPLFDGDRVASYYLAIAIFVAALALSLGVRHSRAHYAVTAIRANETVAAVMGVNVVRTKVLTFTASAVVATLAGAFYMPFITHTDPHDAFDISRSVAALVFPIFGGLYTTAGPVLGTVVLRAFEEYLRVTPPWKEGYQVVYGAVIVIAVLFIPRGVLGLVQRYAPRAGALLGRRPRGSVPGTPSGPRS
ncbi:MAG: branched-chain amino acid ABC transporter permease [Chloroflexota bacterium]|nr:branched-chain amino acid ABC transporter permease [Chloroflexota bacterium]